MNETIMEIDKDTELYENYTGTILLTEKAILIVLAKVSGDIFLSPDCQLVIKGDVNGSTIYADRGSMIDIMVSQCCVRIHLNEAWIRIESDCELIGEIISDGGHIIGQGKYIELLEKRS